MIIDWEMTWWYLIHRPDIFISNIILVLGVLALLLVCMIAFLSCFGTNRV
jgi:hypothetical protein